MRNFTRAVSYTHLVPIPTVSSTTMSGMSETIDKNGNLAESAKANPYGPQKGLDTLLVDLKWYSDALAAASAKNS